MQRRFSVGISEILLVCLVSRWQHVCFNHFRYHHRKAMASINIYLRDNLGAVPKKNMAIAPDIPEKKLNNAVSAFAYSGSVANVVGLR